MMFKKRRYDAKVFGEDLPSRGERTAYLGKVAEDGREALLDIDELTHHIILAGATGGGKTTAAQIIVEECLAHDVAVLVIDPTAQWTGFLKPLDDSDLQRRYRKFGLSLQDRRGYTTMIVASDMQRASGTSTSGAEIVRAMVPGVVTVIDASEIGPQELDAIVDDIINAVFQHPPQESRRLKTLLVFDEIHRILPKFGGSGKGSLALERACREFRKWGIGMMLISQVLEDFLGAIRANIGTEIQMRTAYEEDLAKAQLKYGEAIARSIVREEPGTGLMHNADYNLGLPFFVEFRPPYHDPQRLPDTELREHREIVAALEQRPHLDERTRRQVQDLLQNGQFRRAKNLLKPTPPQT